MPKLRTAPTPQGFAKEWTREFAAAVRRAAGKDGRLSVREAKRIASRQGAAALFSDNASNFLREKGQRSVDVEKLIAAGHRYAAAVADKAAGRDGRVSHADASALPADLRADYAYLRGKGLDELRPVPGDSKRLMALAARHVLENAGGEWEIEPGKLYPGLDSGEEGLRGHLLEGEPARRVAAFLEAYHGKPDRLARVRFDPAAHALVAVSSSFDEAVTYFSRIDRATGEVSFLCAVEMVDVADGMEEQAFASFFPELEQDVAGGDEVQESLLAGAAELDLGNG